MPVKEIVCFKKRDRAGFKPLLVTLPHSGERIPPEADWLKHLPERLLMYDVDRFVDELYEPTLKRLCIPTVVAPYHRYACDLNRLASDVDAASVVGSENRKGTFPRGLHWSITTEGDVLMPAPLAIETHRAIVRRCFDPFHLAVRDVAANIRAAHRASALYHLDLHSMPSFGTKEHRDPGAWRADLVISNQDGRSSSPEFFQLVCQASRELGFSVAENWPYKGGRITEVYGRPGQGWETVQIELNRKLYMDESTKRKIPIQFHEVQLRVGRLIEWVHRRLG